MTKLEEKLIELGYEKEEYLDFIYFRYINNFYIFINSRNLKKYGVECPMMIYTKQKDINNLQQAFDVMQKDLEVLKQCQN